MAHHTHLKVGACTGAVHPPRWAMENVFDFLDDASLCVGLGCCRAWHACGTEGAWAAHAWASRGECAVVGAAARAADCAEDRCVARALGGEFARRHCCARGLFLGLAYAPACQRRRLARRRRREVDAAALRWRDERSPLEAAARRSTRRLRFASVVALFVLGESLGGGEAVRVAFVPSRILWRASRIVSLAHAPLADGGIDSKFSSSATTSTFPPRNLFGPRRDHHRAAARSWRDAMPWVHAALAPEALDLRRYAFFTSVLLFVLHVAVLAVWWRFLWYALGALLASAFNLGSLDVAERQLDLAALEERSEARFSWMRAVVAEREEALYLVAVEDAEQGSSDFLWTRLSALRISAWFHQGGRAPTPPNPYRGDDDVADDDAADGRRGGAGDDVAFHHHKTLVAGAAARRPSLGPKKRHRSLASLLKDLLFLNQLQVVVLCVSSATLLLALAVVLHHRADAEKATDRQTLLAHYATNAAAILATSVYQDATALALIPVKVAFKGAKTLVAVLLHS